MAQVPPGNGTPEHHTHSRGNRRSPLPPRARPRNSCLKHPCALQQKSTSTIHGLTSLTANHIMVIFCARSIAFDQSHHRYHCLPPIECFLNSEEFSFLLFCLLPGLVGLWLLLVAVVLCGQWCAVVANLIKKCYISRRIWIPPKAKDGGAGLDSMGRGSELSTWDFRGGKRVL